MSGAPTRPIRLFGTDEPAPAPRILRAGALTAELDAGNLRHIRLGDVELIRAVSFIVRDRNWGTYNPLIRNLAVEEDADGFTVTYQAEARDDAQAFTYRASIVGRVSGEIAFHADGTALGDFSTNRTGFVVLHPIVGVAGRPVRIEHADGTVEDGLFPDLIDPVQPMMGLRALTHEAAPGLSVTCRMEGDIFEMEDQRNWTDASYKTYVRPLALPWPYTLASGEALRQSVAVTVSGGAGEASPKAQSLQWRPAGRAFPPVGACLDPQEAASVLADDGALAAAGLAHIVCHYNPQAGHGRAALEAMVAAAAALGAEPWLEAVIVSVDGFEAELADLGTMVAALGHPFSTVMVTPAPDLKCTLPGSPWPDAPPDRAFFQAARRAFPGVRLGGGMISYFTEMNRKRPPADLLDMVSFTTTATLHAGDDHSIMEGLESLPAIAASAAGIAAGRPVAVGPGAIGMRMNPYGDAPMANPGNIRQAMNYNDPRQRGLLGAAWTLGYVSRFAAGGATAVTLGGLTGAFGLRHIGQSWPQPWYDQHGGLFPAYHVMRGVAALAGRPMLTVDHPDTVEALAAETDTATVLWIANRTGQTQKIALTARPETRFLLDEDSFEAASRHGDAANRLATPFTETDLTLEPYAVAKLTFGNGV